MYGAILGDMIGAPYEFDRGDKTKAFPLFIDDSRFTDDTVMTIAVAEALLDDPDAGDKEIKAALMRAMQKWGRRYPRAGYGRRFSVWLQARHPRPYGSYGNGAAMRVSAAGWLYGTLGETRRIARLTAEVTHDHPEGIKGAEAAAAAVFMARNGAAKGEIRDYIVREFGYDLSRTCDEIRPGYHHVESCQETVPEAITAFLEGTDFEDVIRTAVSLGGDCDTLTCIAGSVAEAFYGVPASLVQACRDRLPDDMIEILDRFAAARIRGLVSSLEGKESMLYSDPGDPYESIYIRARVAGGALTVTDSECEHGQDGGWSHRILVFDGENTEKVFAFLSDMDPDPFRALSGMLDYRNRTRTFREACSARGIEFRDQLAF